MNYLVRVSKNAAAVKARSRRRVHVVITWGVWGLAMILAVLILVRVVSGASSGQVDPLRPLLNAVRQVESGSKANPPDGDGGKAIGPYQIWKAYWIDARMPDGTYQDCRKADYAERVMLRYWRRHCPAALAAGDFEVLARVHNGGPKGAEKKATLAYWKKVSAELEKGAGK